MAKNVIIIGMARSGTSLTASIFAKSGYFVAEDENKELQNADEFNPSGYWEASQLLDSNKEILKEVGFNHDNTWFFDPISEEQASKIFELPATAQHQAIVDSYNSHSPWVWKDPRLCYTLAYWWPLLDANNTKVLIIRRNPEEIYNSFINVTKNWASDIELDREGVYRRINDHIESAKKIVETYDIPFIEIDYSEFAKSPAAVTSRLSEFFEANIEKDAIGYRRSSNHSTFIGKLNYFVQRSINMVTKLLSKMLKSIKP